MNEWFQPDGPLIIDLACGPGGFSDGWELAGGSHRAVIGFDWAYYPRASYRHGINGYRRAYYVNLFEPEDAVRRILRATGGRRPDWVIGSSSCKPFTTANSMNKKATQKRGAEDTRDTLLAWFKVVGRLSPRFGFVMENVPRAQFHPDWPEAINSADIPIVAEWTMRASDYGLDTSRERRFWIGRRDWSIPAMPSPNPRKPRWPSVIKNNGVRPPLVDEEGNWVFDGTGRPVPDPTQAVRYLAGYTSGAGGFKKLTHFTNEEALVVQGAPGKYISGGCHASAQQIADMVPPPLAAVVIRAAVSGTGLIPEVIRPMEVLRELWP